MFLKSLTISSADGTIIRSIAFHTGINLIVDDTPFVEGMEKETGNSVGKTTVLKLIDFCLGGSAKAIYTDPENRLSEDKLVKDFLIEYGVLITLVLKEDLSEEDSDELEIERNFLSKKNQRIQRINGEDKTDEEFDEYLTNMLFPGHYGKKPTFRQIIAHNVRYRDVAINNTLKNLDKYTSDVEYETLYLFLLGCDFEHGDEKQEIRYQIDLESKFKKRLEAEQTKSAYETALDLIHSEIRELERKKSTFNLNPNFELDLKKFDDLKFQVNLTSSQLGRLELRRDLVREAQRDVQESRSKVDLKQLQALYEQARALVPNLQKTFEELNEFHNKMVVAKMEFIAQDLPSIEREIQGKKAALKALLEEESILSKRVVQSESFAILEKIILALNSKYESKGKLENVISQIDTVDEKLASLSEKLNMIDAELFSKTFESKVKDQLNKFNKYFSSVSDDLYGEKYALTHDIKTVKGLRVYKFRTINVNFSSGKKQGEISCFDIAYTLFADDEGIPCLHFLLTDKKELMHDNQLLKIAALVDTKNIQFVASILKDKLPSELNKEKYIVLKLSPKSKLFKIEKEDAPIQPSKKNIGDE